MRICREARAVGVAVGVLAAGCAASGGAAGRDPSARTYGEQKVVYHLNDHAQVEGALRSIGNHVDAVGAERIRLAVVAHGKGMDFLLAGWKDAAGKDYAAQVQELVDRGVRFMVCEVTVTRRKIDRSTVNPLAVFVPSGVAAVAELQAQGYAYIRP